MDRREIARERWLTRHRVGTYFGYFGLFFGLLSVVAGASEGTPFQQGEMGWVVFGSMLVFYALGWALGPVLAGAGNPQR